MTFCILDECTDGNHACHVNAICNNSERSYSCSCKDGYKGDGFLNESEYLSSLFQLEYKLVSTPVGRVSILIKATAVG